METFLPKAETVLRNAYSYGVYDHPALASASASRELLLREYIISCLYWHPEQDPLQTNFFLRRDEMLPTRAARETFRAHFRMWGQNMTQARIEGHAIRKGTREFVMPHASVTPPMYFYPTIGLDFLVQNYLPGMSDAWLKCPQEHHPRVYALLYHQAAVRAREVVCLLGIYLEHALEEPVLSDYRMLFDRALFTLIALMPVIRLGMPGEFCEFVRDSLFSFTSYFYSQADTICDAFIGLPRSYYNELLEGLSELCNLKPRVTPLNGEDDDFLGAA
jgi:hypothetical protein